MRFERMIRLAMLTGAALALPGTAMAAGGAVPAIAKAAGQQAAEQSAEDYEWIDRADALWDAIGDAPPDFAFSFEGAEPWAWQTADGYTIIVEDAGTGGIRSYYFAPGARGPFLAVEPGMSFGYDAGRLAMVYDADGEAAPRAEFADYDDPAEDLYDRGVRLHDALAGRDYRPVDTQAWIDASPYLFSFIQVWDGGYNRYPGWARYRARSDAAADCSPAPPTRQARRVVPASSDGRRPAGSTSPSPAGAGALAPSPAGRAGPDDGSGPAAGPGSRPRASGGSVRPSRGGGAARRRSGGARPPRRSAPGSAPSPDSGCSRRPRPG